MARIWQLQEAENRFSEVVNAALTDGPQLISRHGEEVVVVLSIAEYQKSQKTRLPLGEFFRQSPLAGAEELELELERDKSLPMPGVKL